MTTNATPPGAPHETRLERRLESAVDRATTPRGAAVVIASASIRDHGRVRPLMTVVDRENYPSFGSGLWWAHPDDDNRGLRRQRPRPTFAGRFIAAVVMMFGIAAFLTVITAADHEHVRRAFTPRAGALGILRRRRRSTSVSSTADSSESKRRCPALRPGSGRPRCRRPSTSVGSTSDSIGSKRH